MSIVRVGDWGKGRRLLIAGPSKTDAALKIALRREAELFRKEVIQGIRDGAPGGKRFKPLSRTTLAMRRFKGFRGKKPLIVGGDLRRSIKVVPGPGGFFVGVLRGARGKNRQVLINVAAVQEFGATFAIKPTDEMRRFLAMVFRQAGLPEPTGARKAVYIIKIPPRPFLQPVFDKLRPGARLRVETHMAILLGPR